MTNKFCALRFYKHRVLWSVTLITLAVLVVFSPARAATFTWTGAQSQDWHNPTNWRPVGIPGPEDTAFIPANSDVTTTNAVTVFKLNMNAGSRVKGAGDIKLVGGGSFNDVRIGGPASVIIGASGVVDIATSGTNNGPILGVPGVTENVNTRFDGTVYNYGTINLTAGNLLIYKGLRAMPSSTFNITGNGYIVQDPEVPSSAEISGRLVKTGGGSSVFSLPINNRGQVDAAAGTLDFRNGFTQISGTTHLSRGTLTSPTALQYLGGRLDGSGVVQTSVNNQGAVVAPGNSPGSIVINGSYTQTSNGTLQMELGGLVAGTNYDQLTVNGPVTLAGTLDLAPFAGFTPKVGDSFELVKYLSVSGDFSTVTHHFANAGISFSTSKTPSYLVAQTNEVVPPTPSLTINDVGISEGNSGTTNATLIVSLSEASASDVSVNFTTTNGTALSASDFTAQNGTLTFTPGQTSKNIVIAVNGDTSVEPNEEFYVDLSSPVGATIVDNRGVVTIINDDAATLPTLSINDVSITEGNNGTQNLVFTATLSQATSQAVTVQFDTANGTATAGSDYTAKSGTLTIPIGQTSGTISVVILGDTIAESNDSVLVNLSSPTNATLSDSQGVGTILNDDVGPGLSIDDVTVTEGNAGTTNATFTITLSAASAQGVSVNVIPSNGSARSPGDYVSGGARLIFNAGETVKTFSVPIKGDLLDETDETIFVILSASINATIARGRGVGTILDDDAPPSITIDDVLIGEGNAGQRVASFRLKLSAPSGQIVRVSYATNGGSATAGNDYNAVALTQIAFTTGNVFAYARVFINGDVLNEPNETFNVNLSNPIGATIADSQALGTILNDDSAPSLTINDVSIAEGNSGTKNLNFSVTLSKPSGQTVTVNCNTADGIARSTSDYVAKTSTLTFSAGQTTQTISVVINGDTQVEGDETLFVLLSASTNASIGKARGTGTITNDDLSN